MGRSVGGVVGPAPPLPLEASGDHVPFEAALQPRTTQVPTEQRVIPTDKRDDREKAVVQVEKQPHEPARRRHKNALANPGHAREDGFEPQLMA